MLQLGTVSACIRNSGSGSGSLYFPQGAVKALPHYGLLSTHCADWTGIVTLVRGNNRITLDDVAREANVSSATVSRVVNNKGYVSTEVRDRVMAALVRTG